MVLLSLLVSFGAGCNLWRSDLSRARTEPFPFAESTQPSGTSLDELEQLLACTTETHGENGETIREPTEGWYLPANTESYDIAYRWRHAGLERWLATPAESRPDLTLALRSTRLGVRAVAGIGLARTKGERYAQVVARLARDTSLAIPTRCAAMETAMALATGSPSEQTSSLFGELIGRPGKAPPKDYDPQLHMEFLRCLAKRDLSVRDPRLAQALEATDLEVRIVALEILAASPGTEFPADATRLLADAEPRVRVAALQAAAAKQAPAALAGALKAVRDGEPAERLAGILALGAIGGNEALAELRRVAARDAEVYQEAAVTQLGNLADWPAVREAALDKSWRVRRGAAAALAGDMSAEGQAASIKLLADPASQVQLRIVESAATWPLERGGPLLLAGLESRQFATRKSALAALTARWPPAEAVSATDLQPLVLPRAKIDQLRQAWTDQFGSDGLPIQGGDHGSRQPMSKQVGVGAHIPATPSSSAEKPSQEISALRERLRGGDKHARIEAAAALARLGDASGPPVIESLTFDRDPEIRRAAAAAIGTLEDRQFLVSLVRLLDDLPAVRLAALKALPRVAGRDVAATNGGPSLTAPQQAERWKEWHRLLPTSD